MSDSNNIPEKFLKPYDPKETEDNIYKLWEKSGFFNPDTCVEKGACAADAEPFSIVLPPPNVTGTLHMGHASMLAIEDIMVRFERMRGKKTLWLPGTDHAAIATQSKVEKELVKKEKKNRHDLGREEFLKRVNQFAQESHDTIVNQVRKMGSSIDWSREAFTLDEARERAVRTAFKRMYDDGLIYRKNRVINWDPKGQTTVSDDETERREEKGLFYTFKYSKDFPIAISTTRPETKVGDTAVAVHPDDARYKEYVGKEYDVNFAGVPLHIKIIADKDIDPEFGTGAVGITPAHSMVDYEIAERHDLPMIQVINEYAKMMVDAPELKDKKVAEAREIIVDWIRNEGLMEKEEEITKNVAIADRSGGTIEPLPKLQWFIAVDKPFKLSHSNIKGIESGQETTLKELMHTVVKNNQTEILPDRFEKIYFHWIENLHDWCISRQIWYGHRIPVWNRGEETHVGVEAPVGDGWEQDSDTLDTWFSSGLWTFSTLGWPDETTDLKTFHPTSVLETGYDILFFWVARMILMTTYLIGDVPFKTVYLHGLVRDSKGRKMSKSLGNIIDPLDMIEKYGADATRMSLIVGNGPGNDMNLSEDKIRAYKKFANKIWNISRFVTENTADMPKEKPALIETDQSYLTELSDLSKDITEEMEKFNYHIASEKIYHYAWHRFADEIIEECKTRINEGSPEEKASAQFTLQEILNTSLKLLHPFMPFITEEIWGLLPKEGKQLLIVEKWPL
ncbi:valine--tRNA ligase [Patescibacteria group bacterium]